ncbi:MAG: sodium:proton antiporter [Candidatus Thiodiazotropha sp. (ex Ctena orbiculata)]|uniref:Sodium:proton antiporter n=1 Tax=Candidatus Thiodiazotropha taylori TaxID=2792791 RepID=A0A944QVB0_9GAMM|nr:sodium:proton antiporter [Candidatus Thiodiazotropha taylori]MBV2138948.1 sodium:proton antiporter [Candidatus Thiodiazotropha taylori]
MEHEAFVTTVMAVVALLFLAAVSAVITRRIHFPYTIGLVVIGVAVAFIADDYPMLSHALDAFKLEPVMIMFLFIPILIFESAFNMDVPLLMRNLVPSLTLAGPGLLISTALIGTLIHLLTPLPIESALIFGCLISATDPVAVIALFKEVGAPKRLTILMEGESVFNDATAIVTFQIILAVIASGILDVETITGGVVDFFMVFFGGLLVGLLFGWLLVQAIPLIGNQPLVHITLTLVTAYAAFIVADHYLHTSGIMAVLSAGLTIGYYTPTLYKQKVHDYLEMFWEDAAFVANSLIFLMLGLSEKVFIAHTHSNPEGLLYPVLIAIAVVLFVRFLVVNSLVPLLNRVPGTKPIGYPYRMVLSWGGLRGAVAIALAMSLPKHFPYRWQIIDFTFGVTLFTLLVNGTTMSLLIRRLELHKPSPLLAYLSAYGRVEAARNVLARLKAFKPVMPLNDELRAHVTGNHQRELENSEAQLEALRADLAGNRIKRRKLLWLQTFAVQRRTCLRRFEDGLLSRRGQQALETDLKNKHVGIDSETGPMVEDQRLPSDRRLGLGLIQNLQRVLPGIPYFARFQTRRNDALTEESLAVVAGSAAVIAEMAHLAEFSGADDEDVEECRRYYTHLEQMGRSRLDQLGDAYNGSGVGISERMLQRLVQDARKDVVANLEHTGELPLEVAHELRNDFEEARVEAKGS